MFCSRYVLLVCGVTWFIRLLSFAGVLGKGRMAEGTAGDEAATDPRLEAISNYCCNALKVSVHLIVKPGSAHCYTIVIALPRVASSLWSITTQRSCVDCVTGKIYIWYDLGVFLLSFACLHNRINFSAKRCTIVDWPGCSASSLYIWNFTFTI